jgi:hypothetical protein
MVRPKFNDQETFVILWFCTFICFSAFGQEKYSQLSWENEGRFII